MALWQANEVKLRLEKVFPKLIVELNIIKTQGDKILDQALSKIGDKGLFTKEIENALINGEADVAVHSLKDLPTQLPKGLKLGAVLERGEVCDAFISKGGLTINQLTENHTVATSSLRRIAQLKSIAKNVKIKDIRGNVESRINKMKEGYCDAIILAGAGVTRLGMQSNITEMISPQMILPAVSQGIVGIECREDDMDTQEIINKINHDDTMLIAEAERTFLATVEGGCQIPVGCFSTLKENSYTLTAFISDPEGVTILKDEVSNTKEMANQTAKTLGTQLLQAGGKKILDDIRKMNNLH